MLKFMMLAFIGHPGSDITPPVTTYAINMGAPIPEMDAPVTNYSISQPSFDKTAPVTTYYITNA